MIGSTLADWTDFAMAAERRALPDDATPAAVILRTWEISGAHISRLLERRKAMGDYLPMVDWTPEIERLRPGYGDTLTREQRIAFYVGPRGRIFGQYRGVTAEVAAA